jgi:putative hemolysin
MLFKHTLTHSIFVISEKFVSLCRKPFKTFMEFLIILLLLLLNGIFAMYELALVSASKARLETMIGKGNKRAKGVLQQLEEPEKFLSTIQIGITLIGIVSGAYGGATLSDEVEPLFRLIPGIEPYAHTLAVATVVVIITYLSLIIGELVPKSIALSDPEKWATRLSPFMIAVKNVSYPFVYLLSASTKLVNRLIGLGENEERQMTQEELKMILHQSSEQGVIDKEETEMLRDVFRFSDKRANDLMTYRRDIVVMHPNDTREDVLRIISEQHFSKYLLVESGKDEVIGVVSVKDIIIMLGSNQPFNLRSIARPPLFIPESLYAKKVLELFKKNKNKFGVVVDEYGNTEGIITLHDLTESIFGDILEENETEEEEIVRRQDGSLLVEASMNIDDFMEAMGILNYDDLREEDFTTLSGLAMFLIGRVPKAGDLFTYKNLEFEVVDMDRGRVDKLLVVKHEEDEDK